MYGWELGGGLGHVGRLQAIAEVLASSGYQPVFAIRDLGDASVLLKNRDWRIYQAPVFMKPARSGLAASSYADLLMHNGFANAGDLMPQVSAWQTLIESTDPSLIIADHSPTLCLAARGQVPVISIGTGFTLPPVESDEFPRFRDDVPPLAPQQHLLNVIQAVQDLRQKPVPGTVTEMMNTEKRLLCSIPELDPYQAIRQEPGIGPIGVMPEYEPVPLEPSLFVYINDNYAKIDLLGNCLADLDIPVHAFITGNTGVLANFLGSQGVKVYEEAPKLADILPRFSAVIHHGGNFTSHAALVAGRPQLILPRFYEAALNGRILEKLNVAINLEKEVTADSLSKAVRDVLFEPEISGQAANLARTIQQREPLHGLETAVQACRDILV